VGRQEVAVCYDPGVSIAPEFVDIGSLIDQREGYRGGRPFIVGTGVTVDRISVLMNVDHRSPEEIADAVNLSMCQVHAALAFYHANRDEIERWLDEDERAYDLAAAQHRRS
jgi:uncharacterized protein (DUF433 family)